MGLFQTSVLKKYRKLQDEKAVAKAYKKYVDYFQNPERQENIRESKEEQFQEGFLRELFVKVFDYTLNPEPQFNLTTEYKNEKGAKKADGAILKDGKALAVIELKSTKTKDLEKVRQQAFDYKANQSACIYVITSNFEKLRFYINNAVDFEEFNLFTLNEEQFELLYLCLHKENILNNIPLKIKTDSVVAEESITKKFYSDYSQFKRELFRDLVKQNSKNEIFRNELQKEDTDRATKNIKQVLFKKSQKLIDRFLFIFFAEDKGLLPPNSTLRILQDWDKLNELDTDIPLYDRFKLYFKYLDEGRKGTDKKAEIFAYNGGLFKPDPILDSLIIDNQTLYKHTNTLSDYDFESQVGVNILGHIFENSLNEIESINAEIEGKEFDKQKTKRKKDGVFYTPKYITKYIVDNTVGKLCEEKKQELEIKEDEYHKSRKGRKTETLKKLKTKLDDYRNWLLTLTILDPACGSGAFLNQALDFLIKEHTHIDELETSLLGGGMVMKNIENTILENNIYGVDLNEESVEIAKLSLWLRTAQPRRKLNTLNNNIKCGNSLIDSKAVAGDKAFKWEEEFPKIFNSEIKEKKQQELPKTKPNYLKLIKEKSKEAQEKAEKSAELSKEAVEISKKVYEYAEKLDAANESQAHYGIKKGGFDVVIGNPPYVRAELLGEFQEYLSNNYSLYNPSGDLFSYFYEKSFKLLKHDTGLFGFISNTFDKTTAGISIREYLQTEISFLKYIDFTEVQIFEGATTYPVIITAQNITNNNNSFQFTKIPKSSQSPIIDIDLHHSVTVEQNSLEKSNWSFKSKPAVKLISKLQKNKTVREHYGKCYYGVKTALNEAFIISKTYEIGEHVKPIFEGKEISKWINNESVKQLILFESKWTKNEYGNDISEEIGLKKLLNDYPELLRHILPLEERAKKRYDKGDFFWELRNCAYYDLFEKPKIVFPNLQNSNKFSFDETGAYINAPAVILPTNDKFLLAILNSKLVWYFLTNICVVRSGGYIEVKPQYFEQIPIPEINNKEALNVKTESIIALTSKLQKTEKTFIKYFQSQFNIEKLSKKLQNWNELEFADFIKELNKAIKKAGSEKLSKKDEMEWMELFEEKKAEAQTLKSKIEKIDNEIDQMVYQLYGLTVDEIKIVEGAV